MCLRSCPISLRQAAPPRTLFDYLTRDLKLTPNRTKARSHKMSRAIFVFKTFTSGIQRALTYVCFVVSTYLWNLARTLLLSEPVDVVKAQCEFVRAMKPPRVLTLLSIQLVERFYDPLSGTIYMDDQPISDLNIQEFRKQLALVSQEPVITHHR